MRVVSPPGSLDHVPAAKRALLERAVGKLRAVAGIEAIVLGGSHASRAHGPGSDLDVGLYYEEAGAFSIDIIRQIADGLSATGPATVTDFYEWGPWVNGGAWVHAPEAKLDFLYRELGYVRRTIAEAQQGVVHYDFGQQPAYGFTSVIYLAETLACIPLYDPHQRIAELKREVEIYPPALRRAIIEGALGSAEFTLLHARAFAGQGDVYATVGCLTRAAASLTQVLFALNERYFMGDKRAMRELAAFPVRPPGHVAAIERILGKPGASPEELSRSVGEMEAAWRAVVALSGVEYRPRFTR